MKPKPKRGGGQEVGWGRGSERVGKSLTWEALESMQCQIMLCVQVWVCERMWIQGEMQMPAAEATPSQKKTHTHMRKHAHECKAKYLH